MSSDASTSRHVLVTGGGRGIGRVIARNMLSLGWHVAVNDVDPSALAEVQAEFGESAMYVEADVGTENGVEQLFQTVSDQWNKLDGLVNNAALVPRREPLREWTWGLMQRVLEVNVLGMFACSQSSLQLMRASDQPSIVNMSSLAATQSFRRNPGYVTSKGAVEALTRSLAVDLAAEGIRVNAVAPGMIATEPWESLDTEEYERRSTLVPLGRPGRPQEVADLVQYLLSDKSSYLTGSVVGIDGGRFAQCYSKPDEEAMM